MSELQHGRLDELHSSSRSTASLALGVPMPHIAWIVVTELVGGSEVLEWPYTVGGKGCPPPPPDLETPPLPPDQSDRWENLAGPFLVHEVLGPRPNPPLF